MKAFSKENKTGDIRKITLQEGAAKKPTPNNT
jgi:hypothetical protein